MGPVLKERFNSKAVLEKQVFGDRIFLEIRSEIHRPQLGGSPFCRESEQKPVLMKVQVGVYIG